jgi:hypothetical protein
LHACRSTLEDPLIYSKEKLSQMFAKKNTIKPQKEKSKN